MITATVDDDNPPLPPRGNGDPATGTRDDPPRSFKVLLTQPRTWTRAKPDAASDLEATIIRPQQPENGRLKVGKGALVALRASAKGTDFWTRSAALAQSGSESDLFSFTWEVTTADGQAFGTVSNPHEPSKAMWTVPAEATVGTQATIKLTVDDTLMTVPVGDAGNRDDAPVTQTVEIEVADGPTLYAIGYTTGLFPDPTTSGKDNVPAAILTFIPGFTDPENKIVRAEWKWLGTALSATVTKQQDQGLRWTVNPVPFDFEHKEYEVECTIVWGDGANEKATVRQPFKLFFQKKGGLDESDDTSRGINGQNPPNWFDDRPNHWGKLIPDLDQTWYSDKLFSGISGLFIYFHKNGYKAGTTGKDIPPGSVIISSVAATRLGGSGRSYIYYPLVEGIDAVGSTVKHEFRHKWQMEQSWNVTNWSIEELDTKIGTNGAWVRDGAIFDRDRDFIKDSWEAKSEAEGGWGQPDLLEIDDKNQWPQYAYFLNMQYDGNAFDSDGEFDANINGARLWPIGTFDEHDWATPGKQTNPPGF